MQELTALDRDFLDRSSYTLDDVYFDITNLQKEGDKRKSAKVAQKLLYFGSACREFGHRLRWRSSGHCAPCNPKVPWFRDRYELEGYIYIAGSINRKLLKIGVTNDVHSRQRSLCDQQYANAHDWQMIFWTRIASRGVVENEVHRALVEHECRGELYWKDGGEQGAREIFRCAFSVALAAVRKSLVGIKTEDEYTSHASDRYEFRFED